jgi:hypothetical protein
VEDPDYSSVVHNKEALACSLDYEADRYLCEHQSLCEVVGAGNGRYLVEVGTS